MVPIVDSMPVPGLAAWVVSASPMLLIVGGALVAWVAWLVSGTGEELRRIAARDFDAHAIVSPPTPSAHAAA